MELPERRDVIAVPQTAVVSSLYGDYAYVVRPAEAKPAEPAPEAKAEGAAPEAKPEGAAPAPAADAAAKPEETEAGAGRKAGVREGRPPLGGLVEVTSGIKAGDVIVTAGQNRLSNARP